MGSNAGFEDRGGTTHATPSSHPRDVAAALPEKTAFRMAGHDDAVSYAELVRRSDQAAQLLRALGARPGDTIAIFLENGPRLPELCWAAKNSGLYYVCISSQLNGADFRYIVTNSEAKLLVTSQALAQVAVTILEERGTPPIPLLQIDGGEPPFVSYEALLAEQPEEPVEGATRGGSMLYSSGTTGRPKGVRMPLEQVSPAVPPRRQKLLVDAFGFGPDMVFVNPAPLYHAAPLRMMMGVHRLGGTVIGFEKFDPELVLAMIERHRATHGFFVPTMFIRMLRLPAAVRRRYDLSSMRVAIHGAAPCPPHVKQQMLDWWGPVIYEVYGGTEGMGHAVICPADWLTHRGSVGRPPVGCELEIRDDQGNALGPGETGLVYFRNANRFSYFKDEEKTGAAFSEDGFATFGDIGHVDADGFLYLTDRQSHMIISGGVNIYPQEAEHILIGHPDVADVAIIGVPDEEFGEQVKAIVEPIEMPADPVALEANLLAYCRARLTGLKCPRSVDFVEKLPRNDLGKMAKHQLRKAYWQGHDSLIG